MLRVSSGLLLATYALAIAACGSGGSPPASSTTNGGGLAGQALAFARCMRSHGVTSFPDPSNGQLSFSGSTSSPAFRSAQAACARLMPQKVLSSSRNESPQQVARDRARLLRFATCMRTHGFANLPDPMSGTPRHQPGIGTVLGEGGAFLPIPTSINAHSQSFVQTATTCGINPLAR